MPATIPAGSSEGLRLAAVRDASAWRTALFRLSHPSRAASGYRRRQTSTQPTASSGGAIQAIGQTQPGTAGVLGDSTLSPMVSLMAKSGTSSGTITACGFAGGFTRIGIAFAYFFGNAA